MFKPEEEKQEDFIESIELNYIEIILQGDIQYRGASRLKYTLELLDCDCENYEVKTPVITNKPNLIVNPREYLFDSKEERDNM